MKRAVAKIVLKLLNIEQKQRRLDILQEMLMTFNDDLDLLKKVITADESWVYGYDIETKAQSSQWKRPEDSLLTVFFNCNGVVHHECL